jgi:hypothetical protein
MFQKIKYWFIELYLTYNKMQQGIIQYRACIECGNKHWFEIIKCPCGNCNNEAHCICNKCDKNK